LKRLSISHSLVAAVVALLATAFGAPARAQQISITTAPDLGTIISAQAPTTFTFNASAGDVSQSGDAIRRSSAKVRALVSITCNVTWCNKLAGKVTVQSNGSVSGRAGALSNFTIAPGSGINITSGPSGSNPTVFNIAAIGSNKTVTFYIGANLPLDGDSSTKASGPAASGFRVTVEDTTKASNNASKDGAATANVYHAIRIAVGTPLKFGRIVLPSSGSGSVAMQPSTPSAIPSSGAQLDPAKTTNGSFTVSGEAGTFYNLTVPSKITLSNGAGNTFDMNISTTASGARQFTGSAGTSVDFTFTIGGSFTFTSSTPGGAYTGAVPVTVQYQ
jgi:hypothetical protein